MRAFAKNEGINVEDTDFVPIETKAGSLVLHHQDVCKLKPFLMPIQTFNMVVGHGSAPNASATCDRYAVVSHLLRSDVTFRTNPPPGYIYGRYNIFGSDDVLDSFFPVLWPEPMRSEVIRSVPVVELEKLESFQ